MRRPDRYEDLGNGKHRAWFGAEYVDVTLSRERDYPGLQWDCIHLPLYEMAEELLPPEAEVMDVGCGAGYGSALLSDRGHCVIGMDVSNEALAFAALSVPLAEFCQHNFDEPLYSDIGTQDAIVAIESIEHVTNARTMLQSLRTNCKRGGLLFLTTPEASKDHHPSPFHVREYSRDELTQLVTGAGWVIERWLSHRDFPDTMIVVARKP